MILKKVLLPLFSDRLVSLVVGNVGVEPSLDLSTTLISNLPETG